MSIHPHAQSFGAVAAEYEKGRPTYPPAAVSWLAESCGIGAGTPVLDLAAGTGKFTRALVERGAEVVAVEPVEGMRARLQMDLPQVTALYGTAERIPLPDAAVHAVTVAQAFHWFDHARALQEIHRVLVAQGRLGVIFNVRQPVDHLEVALEQIWDRYRRDVPTHSDGRWREAMAASELFGPVVHQSFEMEQVLRSAEEVVARATSTSFIASLPRQQLGSVVEEIHELCRRSPTPAVLHYRTDCYWSHRL
ncbi:MAG TPA: class I SAM-dependent methyltransferase [Acidimicrobiales bacterium]|nr:class I SAM-dependent methyltransferase [Acidimicrobiales bacterium]